MTSQALRNKDVFAFLGSPAGATALAVLAFAIAGAQLATAFASGMVGTLENARPYLFLNYFDHGFIRRGLTGTIATLLGVEATPASVTFIYLSGFVLLLVLSARMLWRAAENVTPSQRGILFCLLMFSPATFSHFALDPGRFDVFLAVLLLLGLDALARGRSLACAACLVAATLIHESAFILFSPLALLVIVETAGRATLAHIARRAVTTLAAPCIVFLALFFLSDESVVTAPHVRAALYSADPRDFGDPLFPWASSLAEAMRWVRCIYSVHPTHFLTVLLPMAFLLLHVAIFIDRRDALKMVLALGVVIGAATMCVVAADQSRYIALSMMGVWFYAMAARKLPSLLDGKRPVRDFSYLGFYALGPLTTFSGFNVIGGIFTRLAGRDDRFMDAGVEICTAIILGGA